MICCNCTVLRLYLPPPSSIVILHITSSKRTCTQTQLDHQMSNICKCRQGLMACCTGTLGCKPAQACILFWGHVSILARLMKKAVLCRTHVHDKTPQVDHDVARGLCNANLMTAKTCLLERYWYLMVQQLADCPELAHCLEKIAEIRQWTIVISQGRPTLQKEVVSDSLSTSKSGHWSLQVYLEDKSSYDKHIGWYR